MKAESIADLLHARRSGAGRWTARCPVHGPDRHPSLSIGEGRDGCVLLLCRSHNCPPEQIVSALGLTMRDLFDGTQLTPAERVEAARRSQVRDTESRAVHHAGVERNRGLYRLERLRDSLGGLLGGRPDDVEAARLFQRVLDKLQQLQCDENAPGDGPMRCDPMPASPAWITDTLHEFGRNFQAKKTARSQRAA